MISAHKLARVLPIDYILKSLSAGCSSVGIVHLLFRFHEIDGLFAKYNCVHGLRSFYNERSLDSTLLC